MSQNQFFLAHKKRPKFDSETKDKWMWNMTVLKKCLCQVFIVRMFFFLSFSFAFFFACLVEINEKNSLSFNRFCNPPAVRHFTTSGWTVVIVILTYNVKKESNQDIVNSKQTTN